MEDEIPAQQLHDRATRGETLTQAEQSSLDAWYANQDREEDALLAPPLSPVPFSLPTLRHEVEVTQVRLRALEQRNQEVAEQNEALRAQIAVLNRRVPSTPQAA